MVPSTAQSYLTLEPSNVVIDKLHSENPLLKGKISSVRIIFNRADISLVILSLLCKVSRDQYLKQGRLKLDAVIEVDHNKEVRS